MQTPDSENSSFGSNLWLKKDSDYHCSLKEMKDAIIVAYYLGKGLSKNYYSISPRSYFPFKNEIYELKFDKAEEAIKLGEKIVVAWVQSLFEIPEQTYKMIKSDKLRIE